MVIMQANNMATRKNYITYTFSCLSLIRWSAGPDEDAGAGVNGEHDVDIDGGGVASGHIY